MGSLVRSSHSIVAIILHTMAALRTRVCNNASSATRLAVLIDSRDILAPVACSYCDRHSVTCRISTDSTRCSQCVLHRCDRSLSSDLECMILSQELRAVEASIASVEDSLQLLSSSVVSSHQQLLRSSEYHQSVLDSLQRSFSLLSSLRLRRSQLSRSFVDTSSDHIQVEEVSLTRVPSEEASENGDPGNPSVGLNAPVDTGNDNDVLNETLLAESFSFDDLLAGFDFSNS